MLTESLSHGAGFVKARGTVMIFSMYTCKVAHLYPIWIYIDLLMIYNTGLQENVIFLQLPSFCSGSKEIACRIIVILLLKYRLHACCKESVMDYTGQGGHCVT